MLNKGDFMAFRDLSQGALSHKWIIEEGDHFLKNGFAKGDSLDLFIDETKGYETTDATISVLFNKAGLRKVRLLNTFKDSVSFNGTTPIPSVKVGDVWVMDYTFLVDVYAPNEPAFKVFQLVEDDNGNVIEEREILNITEADMPSEEESDTWDEVEVEVGGRLKFVDMTTIDRPSGRTWTIMNNTNATKSADSAAVIYFNKLGFETDALGTFTSIRSTAEGKIPGSTVSKLIPLKVKVIPSTKPFYFAGNLKESADEVISFNVSGEAAAFTGQEGAFTVHVTNENGFNQNISVASVSTKTGDATTIQLVLSAPIYGSDEVTVSYNATVGTITSKDSRVLRSFGPEKVAMHSAGTNILVGSAIHGFEQADPAINNAYSYRYFIGAANADGRWQRTEELAASGIASMRYSGIIENRLLYNMGIADDATIPAGTYIISHKIFIAEGSDLKAIYTDVSNKVDNWAAFWNNVWDVSDLPRGEWVTISTKATLTKDIISRAPATTGSTSRYTFYVRTADNPGVTGAQTFYLDDMSMVPLEVRP